MLQNPIVIKTDLSIYSFTIETIYIYIMSIDVQKEN